MLPAEGWPGFFERPGKEVSGTLAQTRAMLGCEAAQILDKRHRSR